MQTSKIRPLSGFLFGLLLGFISLSLSAAAQTTASNEWTWIGGSSTACGSLCSGEAGQLGVYGTLGVPASGNIPGSRWGAASWTDNSGNFWLFGGIGYGSNGPPLGDVWEFNISTNEWTWMGGPNEILCQTTAVGCIQPGIYGTLGKPAAGNIPGGRQGAVTWIDSNGHFWLYGGDGYDSTDTGSQSNLSDLWEFNPSTNEWAWMGGSSTAVDDPGVYGTLGIAASGNNPGFRFESSGWIDSSGDIWLFGGQGPGANDWGGLMNDLWEFDPSTNEWAWMSGSTNPAFCCQMGGQPGVYGTLGVPAAGNVPGSRQGAESWTDSNGNLWLFGGQGFSAIGGAGAMGHLNDLWKFDPSTKEWAWMGGSSTVPQTGLALQNGGNPGVYGTLGTSATGNIPGSRLGCAVWADSKGMVWLLGGYGFDANGNSGYLNDLWQFNPPTDEWTWMAGSNVLGSNGGQSGVYGTLGTPAPANIPGGRDEAAIWTDSDGNFWLYGGYGIATNGNYGNLDDLWEFQPPPPQPTAAPTFSIPAGTYTATQTVTIGDTTAGATIYYTANGTTPTTGSTVYSSAIAVSSTETLEAIANAPGYAPSPVASAIYIIDLPAINFTVAASPSSLSVTAGQSGTTSVSVTPVNSFASPVSFSCSGLPSGASCGFSPSTVTPPGTTSTTLTVTTSANSAALHRDPLPLLPGSALAAALCCIGFRKRKRLQLLLLVAVSLAGLSLLNACGGGVSGGGGGGGSGSTPVTSTVTVTATSGSLHPSTTFSLTVD